MLGCGSRNHLASCPVAAPGRSSCSGRLAARAEAVRRRRSPVLHVSFAAGRVNRQYTIWVIPNDGGADSCGQGPEPPLPAGCCKRATRWGWGRRGGVRLYSSKATWPSRGSRVARLRSPGPRSRAALCSNHPPVAATYCNQDHGRRRPSKLSERLRDFIHESEPRPPITPDAGAWMRSSMCGSQWSWCRPGVARVCSHPNCAQAAHPVRRHRGVHRGTYLPGGDSTCQRRC